MEGITMSSAFLRSKMSERAGLADLITSTLDKCAKDATDPTPEQRNQLDAWASQVTALDAEIGKLETALNANDRFETIVNRMADADETRERRTAADQREPEPETPKTLGEFVTASPAFTEYRGRGTSDRVEVPDIFGLEAREERAALTTATVFAPTQRLDGPAGPNVSTPLLSAINHERVSTGSFDYVTWPAATGVAKVAEAALKPEVLVAPTIATGSLDTFAGWVQVTRQALEDVPRVRSQIETALRRNLAQVLEAEAAAVIEAASPVVAGADNLGGVREAIGALQAGGYVPTGFLVNPADLATLDIVTMHETNYGPTTTSTYWGLRPIPVPGIPAGTSYVADLSQAVTWFDRGNTDIYVTDSHADTFIRNIFVILAEARAKFAVTNVNAMVQVAIAAPVSGGATARSASK